MYNTSIVMAEEMVGYSRVIWGDLPARGRPVTQMILPSGAIGIGLLQPSRVKNHWPVHKVSLTNYFNSNDYFGIFHRIHQTKKLKSNLNNEWWTVHVCKYLFSMYDLSVQYLFSFLLKMFFFSLKCLITTLQ